MTSSARPTVDVLEGNLRELRKWGVADPLDRRHKVPALVSVARQVSDKEGDLACLKDVLERGTDGLGQVYGKATKALLGICPEAWGKDLSTRRALAHEYYCEAIHRQAVPGQVVTTPVLITFRTHIEEKMLHDLAVVLVGMVEEKD
jgi:hypothetical protein